MSVTHLPDIGGSGFTATTREVFEEGLNIPIMKLVKAGKMNDELMDLIRSNVRFEDMVVGDIMANITCNRGRRQADVSSSWTSTASTT